MSVADPGRPPGLLERLYELSDKGGVKLRDGATYLRLEGLPIEGLAAETRVRFLQELTAPDLRSGGGRCRLTCGGVPVIDFLASDPEDWLVREAIAGLQRSGAIGQETAERFADLDERLALHGTRGIEALAQRGIGLLDKLADHGEAFALEIAVEKRPLVDREVLPRLGLEPKEIWALVWRSPETMQSGLGGFGALLDLLAGVERPLLLLFVDPVPPWTGDFLRIARLPPVNGTVQEVRAEPGGRTELEALVRQHRGEERPDLGERLALPPALFLRRDGAVGEVPNHPLFAPGPLRSALLYALLAWLAETTERDGDRVCFTLPARGASVEVPVELAFDDARVAGESLFGPESEWALKLPLLAHDIQRSAGRRAHRALWRAALEETAAKQLVGPDLISTLDKVRGKFGAHEQKLSLVRDRDSDASPLLEVRVFLRRSQLGSHLEFELRSDASLPFFHQNVGTVDLAAGGPDRIWQDMNQLARYHFQRILVPDVPPNEDFSGSLRGEAPLPAVDILKTRGRALWGELVPDGLKRAYAEFKKREDVMLLLVSDDPSFPWELVKPFSSTKPHFDDPWWAVRFKLARWLAGTVYPAEHFTLGRICCIASSRELNNAGREVEYLRLLARRYGVEIDLPQGSKELKDRLKSTTYGLIHFACHGHFDRAQPGESVVVLPNGERLQPDDLWEPAIGENFGTSRPLVFLNSCHSGRTGAAMVGLGGWAERFIDLECGAFLGCGWEVSDPLAADFAIGFYRSFFDEKMLLGEAVRAARLELMDRQPDNSTWLAYYLFGHPGAKVEDPKP